MAAIEKRISFRCDDALERQLDEILENEILKARRDNLSEPKLTDVIRMAIKEKYARDVTGEEKDTFMEMMKNSFELTVAGLLNSQKEYLSRYLDRIISDSKIEYNVLAKYLDIVLLASDFDGEDEQLFKKAIEKKCIFQEMIEEALMVKLK